LSDLYTQNPVPPSLWHTSCQQRPLLAAQSGDLTADVVIIGAGIAGLSAALEFSKKGIACVVLEAKQPGWGASGRNGGMVIPGLKYDPNELTKRYGSSADSLIDMVGGAADFVFDLVRKYDIDCEARQEGWIQTAHNPSSLHVAENKVSQWQKWGANVRLLDKEEVQDRIGSNRYLGGWIDYRGGVINPLKYTLGLLNRARKLGAKVYGGNRALSITRENNSWCVKTENGYVVRANKVLITTNGYTDDLWPNLKKTILPVNSFIIATEPLCETLRKKVLPYGQACTDSRRLLVYFRYNDEGRFIFGGRGTISEPYSTKQWAHIEKNMLDIFPQLKHAAIEYRWAGRVGVTKDALVHAHQPAPGVYALLGFNGRGIALATRMAVALAQSMITGIKSVFPYPETPIKPIPLHSWHKFYIGSGVAWFRLLDKLEQNHK